MKMKVSDLAKKLRLALGDGTISIEDDFIISSLNWAFNELPLVPKLSKIFSKHYTARGLDANGHYKWNLNEDFRRIIDIPMMNFCTSTGGEVCDLKICSKNTLDFYRKNGIIELKKPGTPCEYTFEVEDDNVYLVIDRPSNIPIIIDYIAYGFPKPVDSMDDEVEISAIAENLIIDIMKTYWLREADDYAFAADIRDYMDNKKVIEAEQALHRTWGASEMPVLGEV